MSAAFSLSSSRPSGLLSDTKLFLGDDSAVAVDVFADQVIQQATTLTDEGLKSTSCCMIFMI